MSQFERRSGVKDTSVEAGSRSGRLNRRQLLKTTTGVAAGLSVAGCLDTYETIAGRSTKGDTITIGVLAPNPDSDFIGQSMTRAATIAVDELNENDGINGRDVELVVGDTNGSPPEARRQYQRLILEEGADVTVGVFASEALMNIIDDIAEQETIHLTSGAATAAVSRLVNTEYDRYKYHFRVGPNNDVDLGRMQVDFMDDMASEVGWDSVALLAEDYDWTEEPWRVYQERLAETGVDIVMEERYSPATNDFSDLYEEAAAAGADTVFITTAHTGTEAMLDWSYPNRPDPQPVPQPFAFGGIHVPMQLPAYYEMVGGACRYGFGQSSATATSEITEYTQDFVAAYQDAYEGTNPVYTGYHTYDAVKLFAEVVESEGTLEADELIGALEDVSYVGAAGTAEFHGPDEEFAHDLVYRKSDSIYFQWQENDDGDGVQEVIWPDEHVTAEYVTPPWLE